MISPPTFSALALRPEMIPLGVLKITIPRPLRTRGISAQPQWEEQIRSAAAGTHHVTDSFVRNMTAEAVQRFERKFGRTGGEVIFVKDLGGDSGKFFQKFAGKFTPDGKISELGFRRIGGEKFGFSGQGSEDLRQFFALGTIGNLGDDGSQKFTFAFGGIGFEPFKKAVECGNFIIGKSSAVGGTFSIQQHIEFFQTSAVTGTAGAGTGS